MKWPWLIPIGLLAATAIGARAWTSESVPHAMATDHCASCHADVPPSDHTAKFIEVEHGPVAARNRAQCTGCHPDRRTDCDACHLGSDPKWHTKAVREPAAGRHQREQHRKTARERPGVCAECHAPVFQRQCASCHRADEAWLGGGR